MGAIKDLDIARIIKGRARSRALRRAARKRNSAVFGTGWRWSGSFSLDDRAALRSAASAVTEKIVERTTKGIDVNGRPFPAYEPDYARWRQKRGLGTKPDYRLTGATLDSLKTRGRPKYKTRFGSTEVRRVIVGFVIKISITDYNGVIHENMNAHARPSKVRKWFAINDDDIRRFLDELKRQGILKEVR